MSNVLRRLFGRFQMQLRKVLWRRSRSVVLLAGWLKGRHAFRPERRAAPIDDVEKAGLASGLDAASCDADHNVAFAGACAANQDAYVGKLAKLANTRGVFEDNLGAK